MSKLVITIDGPAGSGKSSVSKLLAKKLDIGFLDSGAMYRAVTLAAMDKGVDLTDEEQLAEVLAQGEFEFTIDSDSTKVSIDGEDVTEKIRRPEVTDNVRYVAPVARIRAELVKMQREFADKCGKIVTEGRDQGTVVFPDADYKFFLVADVAERARRRKKELAEKGQQVDTEQVLQQIEKRDACDIGRSNGPLLCAEDAVRIDSTDLNLEEVVEEILKYIQC